MNSLQIAFELSGSLCAIGLGLIMMLSREVETDEEEIDY